MTANETAHPAHACPVQIGVVVFIRDANHSGTDVYRRADDTFAFVSHDTGMVSVADRCVLLRGVDVEQLVDADTPYGCDLTGPGLVLLGIDYEDDPTPYGGEVLWDSKDPVLDIFDGHPIAVLFRARAEQLLEPGHGEHRHDLRRKLLAAAEQIERGEVPVDPQIRAAMLRYAEQRAGQSAATLARYAQISITEAERLLLERENKGLNGPKTTPPAELLHDPVALRSAVLSRGIAT